jgi:hypothetical protein
MKGSWRGSARWEVGGEKSGQGRREGEGGRQREVVGAGGWVIWQL